MYSCVGRCKCGGFRQRPGVVLNCSPLEFPEEGSLTEPRAFQLGKRGWPASQSALLLSLPPQYYCYKYMLLCLPFPMAVKSLNSAPHEWKASPYLPCPGCLFFKTKLSFFSGGRWVRFIQNYSINCTSWYFRYISRGRVMRKQRQISNFIAFAISQVEVYK